MRVTLVSTYTHPVALGLRYVSSFLKTAGHDVEVLFMSSRRDTARADWSRAALDAFIERVRRSELIGMSLMTNTYGRACRLVSAIREAGIQAPIVWGGVHPTVAPEESLEVADVVCVGEGEDAMRDLAERMACGADPTNVANLFFRAGGPFGNRRVIRNAVRPLDGRLDRLPFPDYELATHWVAGPDGLEPARPENLRGTLHRLRVETTRGCPYACAFCNNAALMQIYRHKGPWVRKRSADNVIAEINELRCRFPTIEAVNIVDDLFFIRSEEEIDEFAGKYARLVNLPLELDAFPNTITEAKVRSLARLPIALISMGIQSGSPRTLSELYHRPTPIDRIVAAMELFRRYRLRAEYHYIVSNPYEPDANVMETMRFIADHHRGRSVIRVFPLMFYPGTPLYARARADGWIGQRDEAAYRYMYTGRLQFARHDYLGVWLRVLLHLKNVGLPRGAAHGLIGLVTNPAVRWALDRRWFGRAAFGAYQIGRRLGRNLIYQPFIRPLKYLRRKAPHEVLRPQTGVTLPRHDVTGHYDSGPGVARDFTRRRQSLAGPDRHGSADRRVG